MFACNPELVADLQQALGHHPDQLVVACKKVRNACIGAPKRKQRLVDYGLVPVLCDIIERQPVFSKEALVTLNSLSTCDQTVDQVLSAGSAFFDILWQTALGPDNVQTAEAAARVLRTILAVRPNHFSAVKLSEEDLLYMLESEIPAVSALGARVICQAFRRDPLGLGISATSTRDIVNAVHRNFRRSEDDALAWATMVWIDPAVLTQVQQSHAMVPWSEDLSTMQTLCEFWTMALSGGSFSMNSRPPSPLDVSRSARTDGAQVLQWVLEYSSFNLAQGSTTSKPRANNVPCTQHETNLLKKVTSLLESNDRALQLEAATVLAVYCRLSPSRQSRVTSAIAPLVNHLSEENIDFFMACMLTAIGTSNSGLRNIRALLSALCGNETSLAMVKSVLINEYHYRFKCMLRIIRLLCSCEESVNQVLKLQLHFSLMERLPHEDAIAALVNLTSYGDNSVWSSCEQIVKKISPMAFDGGKDVAWSLLLNLSATRKLENKKLFVQSGISLPRLVSDKGLPILRNLAAFGPAHVELIDSVVQPTITFIVSGMEAESSQLAALEFLGNVAPCSETYKNAIFNDSRALAVINEGLDHDQSIVRLAAARCVLNLLWTAQAGDESPQSSSPRVSILRTIPARLASRSPLRFPGMHSSTPSSPNVNSSARQAKLLNAGITERLRRRLTVDEDRLVRDTCQEALNLLSSS